jgi:small subunit ribosomal protein S20
LAHNRSALKRWRQSLKRRARNRSDRSKTRTLLTKAIFAISDDATTAEAAVREAVSALDRSAQKGIIHPNAAARSKSRLLKRFNLATANAVVASAAAAPSAPAAEAEAPPEATSRRRGRAAPPAAETPPPARRPRTPRAASQPEGEPPAPRTRRRTT